MPGITKSQLEAAGLSPDEMHWHPKMGWLVSPSGVAKMAAHADPRKANTVMSFVEEVAASAAVKVPDIRH